MPAARPEDIYRDLLDQLTKRLADEGKLVEAGWVALRKQWIPPTAPPNQIRDLRWAYMAGAQHLWASVMGMMEAGEEPTDTELKRMELIAREMQAFYEEMKATLPAEGRG